MVAAYSFTIPGRPVPKARARARSVRNKRTGKIRLVFTTPKKTKAYEKHVGWCGLAARPEGWLMDAAYDVTLYFVLPDRRRADIDNMEKSILDGLNKIAWNDDHQVTRVVKEKIVNRDAEPHAHVVITMRSPF